MSTLPPCPKCNSEYTYQDGDQLVCPECAHEWTPGEAAADADASDSIPMTASCSALHALRPALPSGIYAIDPDGAGPISEQPVHCDMVFDGGGWTLIFSSIAGPQSLFAPGDADDVWHAEHLGEEPGELDERRRVGALDARGRALDEAVAVSRGDEQRAIVRCRVVRDTGPQRRARERVAAGHRLLHLRRGERAGDSAMREDDHARSSQLSASARSTRSVGAMNLMGPMSESTSAPLRGSFARSTV